jgi:DNA polymerase III epsilon subunit-like protein
MNPSTLAACSAAAHAQADIERLAPATRADVRFTAIDFETANTYANSACAIGLVRVEHGRVIGRGYHMIRPPFQRFDFTELHQID